MRAVVYPRVSSQLQRDRDTIASQLRVLPEFVTRQGWTLAKPPETYVDDGHSAGAGKLERRRGLAALLRDATARKFDVVVVVDIDRLTRSEDLTERGAILGTLQRAGVRIASTKSGQILDLSTSSGDLFTTLQAFFAAEWARKHRERVLQGKITSIQRGRLPSGPPPWGLLFDRDTGAWSIDPVRGPLVREMFERVARGESCRAIADDMHMRGIGRPRGEWCRAMVARIIRSRHPVGEWLADRRKGLTVAVPPIVDEDLWQRAQSSVAKHGRRGLRKTRFEYLLEGLIVCGRCGRPYGIRTADATSASAYVCNGRRLARRGAARCASPILKTADADARAWAAVCREIDDPDLGAAIAGALRGSEAERRDWEADAEGYRRKLDRLQTAETKLLERFTRGAIGEQAMDAELARIARERTALHAQLETAGRATTSATATAQRLRDASEILAQLRARLPDAPFATRQALVQRLVRRGGVVIDERGIRITLLVPRSPGVADHVEQAASNKLHEIHEDNHLIIRTVA